MEERLQYRIATAEDAPILYQLFTTWREYPLYHDEEVSVSTFVHDIEEGDLPPVEGVSTEHFRFTLCYLEQEAVAYYAVYEGYPHKETAWISIFIVDEKQRRNHLGHLILKHIEEYYLEQGYTHLALGVHSKNFIGFKFWLSQGFDKVIRVRYEEDYMVLGLEKRLEGSVER